MPYGDELDSGPRSARFQARGRDPVPPDSLASGQHERHLARGALVQQGSQVFGTFVMLIVITILGRTLTLSEFGTYGLVVATSNYLLIVHGSVQSSAVRAIALARDQEEQDRLVSNAIVLHVAAGFLAGSIVAGVGWVLVGALGIPNMLKFDARLAVLILGLVMFLGWPLKVFQDLLLGTNRFVDAAIAETAATLVFGGGMAAFAASHVPLWLLMGMGGGLPVLTGLASAAAVRRRRVETTFCRAAVDSKTLRELAGLSGNLLLGSASALVIYALDRVILATFRGASAVGLYEGPVRIHNFVQTVQSTFGVNVLPAAARYQAADDQERLKELVLRGMRYVLVITLPLTITLMVLAKPLLSLWLGSRFGVAAPGATVLLAYWLLSVNQTVPSQMLVAGGYARWLARYSWIVALANLVTSTVLASQYGLNGVVLGTTIPFILAFPIFLTKAGSVLPLTLKSLLRAAWIPGYSTGILVGGALLAVRLAVRIDNLAELIGLLAGAPLAYWTIFYAIWTTPNERTLVHDLLRSLSGHSFRIWRSYEDQQGF